MAKDITIRMKCKAFRGQGAKLYAIRVSDDEVRVWDDVAEYYTTCHDLCPAAISRAKRLAMAN